MIVIGTMEVCLFVMHFHFPVLEEGAEEFRSCRMMKMSEEEVAAAVDLT